MFKITIIKYGVLLNYFYNQGDSAIGVGFFNGADNLVDYFTSLVWFFYVIIFRP